MNYNVRVILTFVISMLIITVWQEYYIKPISHENPVQQKSVEKIDLQARVTPKKLESPQASIAVTAQHRLAFDNENISGSINLIGARLDDLVLKKHYETLEGKNQVRLLAPADSDQGYFVEFGWLNEGNKNVTLPNSNSIWRTDSVKAEAGSNITLYWLSPEGVRFEINYKFDDQFMFAIEQRVTNQSNKTIKLRTYSLLNRFDPGDFADPDERKNMMVHEGFIGTFDQTLKEISYSDIRDEKGGLELAQQSKWLGFSDKYWFTALIPHTKVKSTVNLSHYILHEKDRYQADIMSDGFALNQGDLNQQSYMLFVGPKELDAIDRYQDMYDITLFDRSIDFGILYFLTKPTLILLHNFYTFVGNFGLAILLLTLVIKTALFPLAYKGYKGMNKLKELQPEVQAIQKRYKEEPMRIQQEIMKLYKKNKTNPMSGCLPLLAQMPVFIALYKVLSVSIEMRHAPFYGWIKDLSYRDPTSVFNLFGLIPWNPPAFMVIGVLPIFMAITMYVQQRMNPEPADPTQARVMRLMPVIFLVLFASFPSGLVLYWSFSNILSIVQQYYIKRLGGKK
jgi:YidC/Oxa1 family membrane protein insertase